MERHDKEDDGMKLYDFFKDNKKEKFIFLSANKGNWGDDLIKLGAVKMANRLKLQVKHWHGINDGQLKLNRKDSDVIIYIHGCGGLGEVYDYPVLYTQDLRAHNKNNKIVWGPATVMQHYQFLRNNFILDDKITFFARERVSYNFLKTNFPKMNLEIDDCPSLFLTKEDFKLPNIKCNYNALFLREDKYEKLETVKIEDNLKEEFQLFIDPTDAKTFDEWIALHAHAQGIASNRCHSAILGSILEIPAIMFRNNYHKNRSIWDYSLKDRGVRWLEV